MISYRIAAGKPFVTAPTEDLARAVAQYINTSAPTVTTDAQWAAHVDGLTSTTALTALKVLLKHLIDVSSS